MFRHNIRRTLSFSLHRATPKRAPTQVAASYDHKNQYPNKPNAKKSSESKKIALGAALTFGAFSVMYLTYKTATYFNKKGEQMLYNKSIAWQDERKKNIEATAKFQNSSNVDDMVSQMLENNQSLKNDAVKKTVQAPFADQEKSSELSDQNEAEKIEDDQEINEEKEQKEANRITTHFIFFF